MTYNVFGGMLSLPQSVSLARRCLKEGETSFLLHPFPSRQQSAPSSTYREVTFLGVNVYPVHPLATPMSQCNYLGWRKKLGPDLQEKVVNAPLGRACAPQAEQESNFLGNWGDLDGGSG